VLPFDDKSRVVKSTLVFSSDSICVCGELMAIVFKSLVVPVVDPLVYPAFYCAPQGRSWKEVDASQESYGEGSEPTKGPDKV